MLILAIIVFGMVIGALAQLIIGGKNMWSIDWGGLAIVAGVVGSFIGGLLISLITGHGIEIHPQRHHRFAPRRADRDRRLDLVQEAVRGLGSGSRCRRSLRSTPRFATSDDRPETPA